MIKTIKVPFISGLAGMDLEMLDLMMEKHAAKFAVCECNWPAVAPYSPDCNGALARTEGHLAVVFHVRGLDLRATAMEDNGNSWEDSCCEFFVADQDFAEKLWKAAAEYDLLEAAPQPYLTGKMLMDLGVKPGKQMGEIIKQSFELQLDGKIKNAEDALAWARNAISI